MSRCVTPSEGGLGSCLFPLWRPSVAWHPAGVFLLHIAFEPWSPLCNHQAEIDAFSHHISRTAGSHFYHSVHNAYAVGVYQSRKPRRWNRGCLVTILLKIASCLVSPVQVWRVLDRFGPNLLHYKSIQEIELRKELVEILKGVSKEVRHRKRAWGRT